MFTTSVSTQPSPPIIPLLADVLEGRPADCLSGVGWGCLPHQYWQLMHLTGLEREIIYQKVTVQHLFLEMSMLSVCVIQFSQKLHTRRAVQLLVSKRGSQ